MVALRHSDGPPTHADIEALPEGVVGEILAGELVVSPRPRLRHASVATRLAALLTGPFSLGRGGPGGWIILVEPELRLDAGPDFDTVVPDLAGWRRERLAEVPDEAAASLAPDWICEVLSSSTLRRDRAQKMPFYARAGVSWAWLITLEHKMIEVFQRQGGLWLAHSVASGDETAAVPPFEAVPLELGLIWAT